MPLLNQGLIYTNENCIGCNRCIYGCPVLGANVSKIEGGKNRIYVDDEKCIHCGKCLEMCKHHAREYRDDTSRFLEDLLHGKKISLLVSPVFLNNYPEKSRQVLGYLQSIGVENIYDESFGGDITTWAYLKYFNENPVEGMISEPCPSIVNYIVKYKKELLDKLIPIQSPMMCMAIYAQKYLKDQNAFAYIGSCISKKDEIVDEENKDCISYNITINKLMQAIKDIPVEAFDARIHEEAIGLGVIYPTSGGLKENMVHFMGYECMIRQIEGVENVYDYLNLYADRVEENKQLPLLVDALNCKQGCLFGTGTKARVERNEDVLFHMHNTKQKCLMGYDDGDNPYSKVISRKERQIRIYRRFEQLNLDDFIRKFQKDFQLKGEDINYNEDAIFNSMYKFKEEDRVIDCHSCGYDSCKEMVHAIACGYNFKRNCVHYVKDENLRLYLTDTLSGIPNTNAFMKKCSEIISEGIGAKYFAIFFNIRNMKNYNRKYGSKTGDIILADYSRIVSKIADEDEIVARWGGDNFVALFKKTHMQHVLSNLENIEVKVCRADGEENCKISYRAAIYELTGEEKIAGQVMGQVTTTYSTIKQSKNHIIFFTENLGKKILHNTMVEEMLEPALRAQEFVVYYQPKVCMEDNNMVGAEALVRWVHNGKIIPPMDFIPICENNGFVQQIDFYVLERVCRDIHEWITKGINMVKISFNFSKQHFAERNVAERINAIAEKWKIPKEYLEVEFTETAYIDEFDNLVETIEKLREYKISSSIDDFGTGYSSLSLLQNVRFNTLKLDKSFLNKQARNERNRTVIANIIQMAKELNMDIVAEGIETSEEFKYLKMLSCDVAQGYLFDKPLPKEQFEERLMNKHYNDELTVNLTDIKTTI